MMNWSACSPAPSSHYPGLVFEKTSVRARKLICPRQRGEKRRNTTGHEWFGFCCCLCVSFKHQGPTHRNPSRSSPGWARRTSTGAAQTARPLPPRALLSLAGAGAGGGRFSRVCLTLVNGSGIQLGKQTRQSLGAERSGRRGEGEKKTSIISAVPASLPPAAAAAGSPKPEAESHWARGGGGMELELPAKALGVHQIPRARATGCPRSGSQAPLPPGILS